MQEKQEFELGVSGTRLDLEGGARMIALSKAALGSWTLFLVFVLPSVFYSSMRIYWIWLILGVIVCFAIASALKVGRRLALITITSAVAFLAVFALYWIAISASVYGETVAGADRLENVLYVLIGNFQQGQIWRGLQSVYIQIVMPLIQVGVLVAGLLINHRGGGDPRFAR